jgi:hypothetical protein
MTFLSCLGIGVAFVLAVALLVLAGVLIGWVLPIGRPGPPEPPEGPDTG